jgi:TPR repeat protein
MNAKTIRAALAALAMSISCVAWGDFNTAVNDYHAGRYDSAHAQFLQMAALGDCSSQFNLGAMALHGQGGPQDTGAGAGWLEAAIDNGCGTLVGGRLASLKPKLSDAEQRSAADIVAHYGHAALRAEGVVDPELACRDETGPAVLDVPTADAGRVAPGGGLVIANLTIGSDGFPRDPQILLADPAAGYAAAAVEAWMHGRFTPATRGGVPVASQIQVRYVFTQQAGVDLWSTAPLKDVREAANAGDPRAEYRLGLASYDTGPGDSARAEEFLLRAARDGDPGAQYWIGARLHATAACHHDIDGAVWLRSAARGGAAPAEVMLARDLLSGTPGAAQITEARALLAAAAPSSDYYVMKHVVALLAASPVDAARDPATALGVARRLAAGEIQSDPQMFEAVAAADAANGDFAGAAAGETSAIDKAQGLGWDTRVMQERLEAYRAGRAWHGGLFGTP